MSEELKSSCYYCVYRNWNDEQSKHPSCNLDNAPSECRDFKTQEQYEKESKQIPIWIVRDILKKRVEFSLYDHDDVIFINALDWVLSRKKED